MGSQDGRLERAKRQNGRELHALAALVLWLACFEAAPFLHTSFHASLPAHTHDAFGVARATHCHGDACHEAHADDDVDGSTLAATHGEGSLLHRGVVTNVPPPAVPEVPATNVGRVHELPATEDRPAIAPSLAQRARGPPALA